MKAFALPLFLLPAVLATAEPASAAAPASATPAPATPSAPLAYPDFLKQLITREAMAEFAAAADAAVDAAEKPDSRDVLPGPQSGETRLGLRVEVGSVVAKEATLYYVSVSRKGEELRFSDGAKLVAFVADRAGLPHPVNVTEGEKPVFYAQWLFKPSDWKSDRKIMLDLRAQNRAEKDALKAFALAVSREIEARRTAPRG